MCSTSGCKTLDVFGKFFGIELKVADDTDDERIRGTGLDEPQIVFYPGASTAIAPTTPSGAISFLNVPGSNCALVEAPYSIFGA